jgi:hypothetical protein
MPSQVVEQQLQAPEPMSSAASSAIETDQPVSSPLYIPCMLFGSALGSRTVANTILLICVTEASCYHEHLRR